MLPWLAEDKLGHIQVRTSSHDRQERYLSLRGGHPWLFGAGTLVADEPAVLLQGVLDTLLVRQEPATSWAPPVWAAVESCPSDARSICLQRSDSLPTAGWLIMRVARASAG